MYETFIKHLTSLTKVIDEDEDGRQFASWKASKEAHFAHVWNYLCLAVEAETNIINRVMEPHIDGFRMG